MPSANNERILFYIANPYVFRSGAIGYLYEIAQVFPVVFLSEELDQETERVIKDKNLFPRLEEIVPIHQFTPFSGKRMNLFSKNFYLRDLAKEVLEQYKPAIVIVSSDTHSLFELYLMRFAKRKKILKIAVQMANVENSSTIVKRVDLTNAYLRFHIFLPVWLKLCLVKIRKYCGHFLYYYFLPVLVGEPPFFGKSSYILYKGASGMRDADYQTVFSRKDFEIYLKDGVPEKKLYIVSHPLKTKTKEFFRRAFWKSEMKKKDEKIVLLLLPEDKIGFRKKDSSLISEKEMKETRLEIARLVDRFLPDWQIILKPHPDIKDINLAVEGFKEISDNIKIADKNAPLDKYIEESSVIVELPLAAGTALFTAALQCKDKPILSLDFNKELLGDYYRNFEGIEYIDNKEKFTEILELIRDNKYRKSCEVKLEPEGFMSITNFLEFLIKEHGK
ncbi:MAG: hypothetical protein Q7R53_02335 [bacterium]|nr:hypothetical protein [bacterium]